MCNTKNTIFFIVCALSMLSPMVQSGKSNGVKAVAVKKPSGTKEEPIVKEMVAGRFLESIDSMANRALIVNLLVFCVGVRMIPPSSIMDTIVGMPTVYSLLSLSGWNTLRTLPNGLRALREFSHALPSMVDGVKEVMYETGSRMGVIKDWDPQKNLPKYFANQEARDKTSLWNRVSYACTMPLILLSAYFASSIWQGQKLAEFSKEVADAFSHPLDFPGRMVFLPVYLMGAMELLRGVSRVGSWLGNTLSDGARQLREKRLSQVQRIALKPQDKTTQDPKEKTNKKTKNPPIPHKKISKRVVSNKEPSISTIDSLQK